MQYVDSVMALYPKSRYENLVTTAPGVLYSIL